VRLGHRSARPIGSQTHRTPSRWALELWRAGPTLLQVENTAASERNRAACPANERMKLPSTPSRPLARSHQALTRPSDEGRSCFAAGHAELRRWSGRCARVGSETRKPLLGFPQPTWVRPPYGARRFEGGGYPCPPRAAGLARSSASQLYGKRAAATAVPEEGSGASPIPSQIGKPLRFSSVEASRARDRSRRAELEHRQTPR